MRYSNLLFVIISTFALMGCQRAVLNTQSPTVQSRPSPERLKVSEQISTPSKVLSSPTQLTPTQLPPTRLTPTTTLLLTPSSTTTSEVSTLQTTPWNENTAPLLPAPLYFLSGQSGSQQIWRIEMKGYKSTQVTDFAEPVLEYDISPSTGRLAFIKDDLLWLTDALGANPRTIPLMEINYSQADKFSVPSLAWSPDGKSLVLGGRNGLWQYNVEMDTWEQLIKLDRNYAIFWVDPRWTWAPDGKGLLVKTLPAESDAAQMIYYSLKSGDVIMPDHLTVGYRFSWSVDSKFVYASAYYANMDWTMEPGIIRWSVENNTTTGLIGGGELRIGNTIHFVAGAQEGPDGLLYYFLGSAEFKGYYDRDETTGLRMYRADLDGISNREALRDDTFDGLEEVLWSPDMSLAVILECEIPGCNSGVVNLLTSDNLSSLMITSEGGKLRWGSSR